MTSGGRRSGGGERAPGCPGPRGLELHGSELNAPRPRAAPRSTRRPAARLASVGVTSTSPCPTSRSAAASSGAASRAAQVVRALIWLETSYISRLRGSSWSTSSLRPRSRSYLWTSSPVWAIQTLLKLSASPPRPRSRFPGPAARATRAASRPRAPPRRTLLGWRASGSPACAGWPTIPVPYPLLMRLESEQLGPGSPVRDSVRTGDDPLFPRGQHDVLGRAPGVEATGTCR